MEDEFVANFRGVFIIGYFYGEGEGEGLRIGVGAGIIGGVYRIGTET